MIDLVPAFHVCFPAGADDLPVEIEINSGWGVDSVGLHDFKRLGEEGGECTGNASEAE